MRRIIALILGAIVALFALAVPASAGGTGGARCPNVAGSASVNLQCNADGSVTVLSPNAPVCVGGYFDALSMYYVNCDSVMTTPVVTPPVVVPPVVTPPVATPPVVVVPPFAPPKVNYSQLSISMTRRSIAVDGASDQLASFYHSKSGRTLRTTLRQKASFVNAVYAKVVPTSTDGYGEDVINVRRLAGKTHYKFVAPKGFYVQFVYIEFPASAVDTSASGEDSFCNQFACG